MKMVIDAAEKMENSGNRTHAYWMIAISLAEAKDFAASLEMLDRAMKGAMDPIEIGFCAARLSRLMAQDSAAKADFSWISQLPTPTAKGLAYAGAAAGLVSAGGD